MPRLLRDSPYLYGFHDPGGERIMLEAGVPGWVLFTEALGFDPNNAGGRDYSQFSNSGLGVIVRLNAGYSGVGTLPFERFYDDFARRCANFVRNSPGAHHWIVGNEPNHPIEWPGAEWDWGSWPPHPVNEGKRGEPITPQRYVACYRKVRSAIHALPGHAGDLVLVAAPAPWNPLLTYPGNLNGDWVQYFADVLKGLASGDGGDGIALHTYTHGSDPALLRSEATMNPPFSNRRFNFRAYRNFLDVSPVAMSNLPVFITETDQGDDPWQNENTGWVQAAYAEINEWNRTHAQKIRSLLLYRWPQVQGDRWGIEGKQAVIDDFRKAMAARYTWEVRDEPQVALQQAIEALYQQVIGLQPDLEQTMKLADEVLPLKKAVDDLAKEAAPVQAKALGNRAVALQAEAAAIKAAIEDPNRIIADLRRQVAELGQQVGALQEQLLGCRSGAIEKPAIVDVVDTLPKHPTLPPYAKRTKPVSMIVVHHTDTERSMTVQRLAEYHVFGERKDAAGNLIKAQWPGIGYHFVVAADGVIYQGQRETTRSYHVGGDPNDFSIGVSLIGRFMKRNYDGTDRALEDQVPTAAQVRSTARLVAWLMQEFKVSAEKVVGHRDVWPKATVCPGEHWREGAKWRSLLMNESEALRQPARAAQFEHYVLFWDHGAQWADTDWRNAQNYIAHFRPTTGFSVEGAMLARHVTIVGGDAGVSGGDEARLRSAGVEVHRLAGANEAATRAMLDDLVAKNTPWPGAPARAAMAVTVAPAGITEEPAIPQPDEWTVPDDWQLSQDPRQSSLSGGPSTGIAPVTQADVGPRTRLRIKVEPS
jgi:N-acetyl-anhydromuramyl-L-alanine amidase AmpD